MRVPSTDAEAVVADRGGGLTFYREGREVEGNLPKKDAVEEFLEKINAEDPDLAATIAGDVFKARHPIGDANLDAYKKVKPLALQSVDQIFRATPPSWLVDGVIRRHSLNIFAGESGVGKSIVSTDLAVAVASGMHFLGQFGIPGRDADARVLICDDENDDSMIGDRLRALNWQDNGSIRFLHFANIDVNDDRDFMRLCATIEDAFAPTLPALIVFDSMIRFHRCEENTSAMASVMHKFRRLAAWGPTVWIQHHHGWSNERSRGHTDIRAAVDCEYSIVRRGTAPADYLVFSCLKSRYAPIEPFRLKILSDRNGRPFARYQGPDQNTDDIIKQAVMSAIADGKQYDLPELRDRLANAMMNVGRDTLRRCIDALASEKKIDMKRGDRNRIKVSLLAGN